MGNHKLFKTGAHNDERGFPITETQLVEVPMACKGCGKNPRAHGSSRCEKCSTGFHKLKKESARLQRKVEAQVEKH